MLLDYYRNNYYRIRMIIVSHAPIQVFFVPRPARLIPEFQPPNFCFDRQTYTRVETINPAVMFLD